MVAFDSPSGLFRSQVSFVSRVCLLELLPSSQLTLGSLCHDLKFQCHDIGIILDTNI